MALGSMAAAQAAEPADLAAAGSALSAQVSADQAPPADEKNPVLETITVTATKRTEDVQKVAISMTVLGTEDIERQHINDFKDVVRALPSVSFQEGSTGGVGSGPAFNQVYMRGVVSGGDGNHSSSLPSVGVYLDEQPITTIQGMLNMHMYDIERVEALAGPQGTLYGASSQSGTVRIITNKPDSSAFSAEYGLEANTISDGGSGYVAEGFVNQPLGDKIALRVVAWDKQDAGYIDNVLGTRTYPTSGIVETNASRVKDDYNEVHTSGVRAAMRFDLSDNWTLSPTIITQNTNADGAFGFDPLVGDLKVSHAYPERSDDRWTQAAATLTGKIGNFDLVYAYAHLDRDITGDFDYADYGFWYDTLYAYGSYFTDNAGNLINPAQFTHNVDAYGKRSHEIRISSPKEDRFHYTLGAFWQQQSHHILQRYQINNLADSLSVPGNANTIWLTDQVRQDQDSAVFADGSFDITEKWTLSAGVRFFKVDNSLKGFFGYGAGFSGSTGESQCFDQANFKSAPCVNLDDSVREDNHVERVNLQYQVNDDVMIYGTRSEGFRPGGINRRGGRPPYLSDFLTNWEFGWKSLWWDHRLAFNGAVFHEIWDDFQYSVLGANGLTEIRNAGSAEVNGAEITASWAATYNLNFSANLAFYDAQLSKELCGVTDERGKPLDPCPPDQVLAPDGQQLPVTPKYKGNLVARYTNNIGDYEWFAQGVLSWEGEREIELRSEQRRFLREDLPQGDFSTLDSYVLFDLSAGISRNSWSAEFYVKNAFDERAALGQYSECATLTCGNQPYIVPAQPRTFGVRFSQRF
jgi:outer membrane receptor protein involved in Fe transport